MEYKINVNCNTHDIALAIKEGMRPMQSFFDTTRDNLPFFANQIAPSDGFGNFHHPTFSAAHIPGRWLLALLNAESVTGISPDENAIKNLRKWAFATLTEVKIGFPACMDHEKGEFIKATDLHNLRETMHALFALCKWRKDEKAKELALGIIRSLDRYFDYNRGAFDIDKYYKETGAEIMYSCSHPLEGLLFPPHFGRYIGPLVKFWRATGENEALCQAIALKDVCFRDILLEDGDYDAVRFGGHTHSTTAMISSLAQLGDAINDREIFDRIDAFFKNGLRKIALPFGWCVENNARRDNLVGEINNTSDIMESCLIMGRHGYDGYYAMAEQILRAHFLPAQLLDTSFIPEYEDENDVCRYRMASRAKGAFGFPTPYGHEDQPGAWISFNWDIVGGGVNGLCEAYKQLAYTDGDVLTLPMHFACDNDLCAVRDPYRADGVMTVYPKENFSAVKLRVPQRAKIKRVSHPYTVCGEWIYVTLGGKKEELTVEFELEIKDIIYDFRGEKIKFRWHGEEVIGASNGNRRLCFFESV